MTSSVSASRATTSRAWTSLGKLLADDKLATIVLFLPPALLLYTLFVILPIGEAGFYSAFSWNGFGSPTNWIGFDNYRYVFENRAFGLALRNNVLIIVVSLLIQLPLALALAIALSERFRGAVALRMLFFLPYVLAEIATGLIFSFVYDGNYGLLASIWRLFGAEAPHLLASPQTSMLAILIVIIWKYFGFHMMLYIAALQGYRPQPHRGRPHRRRLALRAAALRRDPPALSDDPALRVLLGGGLAAAVRPRHAADAWRPGRFIETPW